MSKKISHHYKKGQAVLTALTILVVAIIGTLFLINSRAASPYASSSADSGTLSSGAVKQSCSGASDGNCVVFAGSSGGGGGSGAMAVGLNAGGWGGAQYPLDVSGAVKYARLDTQNWEFPTDFTNIGMKVDEDFSGPYNTGGVSAINASNWVATTLSYYQAHCTPVLCPIIEVLNEPDGSWFWGAGANNQTNATAYAALVKATYIGFHNTYGSNAPSILGDYESSGWGHEWWSTSMSSYVDGVIVHPYGGTGSPSQSKLGNRAQVTEAHTFTNKPVYITEVGWPTAVGQPPTGDSLQWPETNSGSNTGDQCNNVYNFISWARSTGYVNAVMIFGWRDYGTNNFYGVESATGVHKASYNALKNAAQSLANPCPNPLSY